MELFAADFGRHVVWKKGMKAPRQSESIADIGCLTVEHNNVVSSFLAWTILIVVKINIGVFMQVV